MREEPWRKTKLQHTTTVWYIGSCTNKRDKLMDTSIQVLSNAKIFGFIYWHSILGWYSQSCHEQSTVKITVICIRLVRLTIPQTKKWQRIRSIHIRLVRSTMPRWMKQWRLLTLCSFDTYAATTDEDRLKSIRLARKMLCTKKVDIYMWLPFVMYAV